MCLRLSTASAFERFAAALNAALRVCGQHLAGFDLLQNLRVLPQQVWLVYSLALLIISQMKRLALLWTVA